MPVKEGQDCLVVIYSSDARQFGKKHILGDQPIQIGRGSDNTMVLDNDSVSRRHCRIEKRGRSYWLMDLESTNGSYVNDELCTELQLRRGDQVKIGDTIFKFLCGSDVEAQYHETIYRMTIVDGLTGVNNKRFLMESLEREIPRARRHQRPLSLVMFDIDHFKSINDNFGHLAGDYVLKELARLVQVAAPPGRHPGALRRRGVRGDPARDPARRRRQDRRGPAAPGRVPPLRVRRRGDDHHRLPRRRRAPGQHGRPRAHQGTPTRSLYEAKRGGRNRVVR